MVRYASRAPLGALLSVMALLASGCETPAEALTPTDDGVSALQFRDIPVPDGMQLAERYHASDSLQIGSYRYANFKYTGAMPMAAVSDYLLERWPQHSWELVDQESSEMAQKLSFRRGRYIADCSLDSSESRTELNVTLRTTLDPEKQ